MCGNQSCTGAFARVADPAEYDYLVGLGKDEMKIKADRMEIQSCNGVPMYYEFYKKGEVDCKHTDCDCSCERDADEVVAVFSFSYVTYVKKKGV